MICIDITHRQNVILAMILCGKNLLTPRKPGSHNRAGTGMSVVRLNVSVIVNDEAAATYRSDHISYFICILGHMLLGHFV